MENLKVRIQLIDETDKVLGSATVDIDTLNSVKELHNRDMINDVYSMLVADYEIRKIQQ